MKRKHLFKFISVALIIIFTLTPALSAAEAAEECKNCTPACKQAKEDAAGDWRKSQLATSAAWFSAGCLLMPVGVLIGAVVSPAVPPDRILGKPQDFIRDYSKCYGEIYREKQYNLALFGCASGIAIGCFGGVLWYLSSIGVIK